MKFIPLLTLTCLVTLAGCGQSTPPEITSPEPTDFTPATYRIAALKGPTSMGLVGLMDAVDNGTLLDNEALENSYDFTLAGSANELLPLLIKDEIDMACLPANLGATLYQKMDGDLQVLAINTLGVLYMVERGESVSSIADLKGKTIVASGQGATPEYSLRYLLAQNGLDPDHDVTIVWKSEHAECVTALASGEATIALLPQPFVTVAQTKLPDLRVAIDLNQAWDDLDTDSGLVTGIIVAKKSTVAENPEAIDAFLEDYAHSVELVNDDTAQGAKLIGAYGIVDEAVAVKALPHCNIVCITGQDMEETLSGYYDVLFAADPKSVGGTLPDESFYFLED